MQLAPEDSAPQTCQGRARCTSAANAATLVTLPTGRTRRTDSLAAEEEFARLSPPTAASAVAPPPKERICRRKHRSCIPLMTLKPEDCAPQTRHGRATHSSANSATDSATIAIYSMAQARRYARNTCSAAPDVPHTMSTSGVYVALSLPQSCGGGNLRPRTKVDASSATGRACTKSTETTSIDSDSDSNSDKTSRKRRKHTDVENTTHRLAFSYPDADEMFHLVERELGLGEQTAFYSPSGWCRPPPGHPDLAARLLGHPSDADESQQERRVKEDSATAADFRTHHSQHKHATVCSPFAPSSEKRCKFIERGVRGAASCGSPVPYYSTWRLRRRQIRVLPMMMLSKGVEPTAYAHRPHE